jgi:hypothetical protein
VQDGGALGRVEAVHVENRSWPRILLANQVRRCAAEHDRFHD